MPGPVLIIHDDVSVIAPAKRVLQREGIDTLLVTNAADAVTTFDDLAPSVVVLAPSVDGGRGSTIVRDIRARRGGQAVKFVLLGSADGADAQAAVLPLPLDGRALLEAVGLALRPEPVPAAAPVCAHLDEQTAERSALELASPAVLDWFDALAAPEVPGLERAPLALEPPARGPNDDAAAPDFDLDVETESNAAPTAAGASVSDGAHGDQAAQLERHLVASHSVREALATADAERAALAACAGERSAELTTLQAELARLRGAQTEAEAELRRASEERQVLRALVDEAQARREQEETRLEDARRAAAEAGAGLARIERAAAEDQARAREARERAEAARAALESARAAAAAELQKAEEERRQLEAETARLESERKEARARAERTRQQREQLRAAAAEERDPRAPAEQPGLPHLTVATAPQAAPAPEVARATGAPVRPAERGSDAPATSAVPAEGTLAGLDAPALVCRIFAARATGRLEVESEEASRSLWFDQGRLVAADSSALVERLEDVALRLGLVVAAQHHALRASEERNARRLAVRMVELGYIRPGEMVGLVRRRVQEIAWAVFADARAPYRFVAEAPPAEARVVLPMHPFGLVLEGIRRKYSLDRLHARLGGPATLLRPDDASVDLDAFGLAAGERALVGRVDGLRTVEELLLEGAVEELAAMQALYAVLAAGAIEVVVRGQPPRARSPKASLELDRVRVADKWAQAVGGDYFQILGLQRDASRYEVHEAHERLAREFDPARFAAADEPSLQERLGVIRQALAEAAEVLEDDAVRAQYARHLVD